ncbi:MAG: ABC transporter permease [Planctomycetes bacterium]|nr:ABC transporter permease [Planctomycetota bacterium]
MAGELWRARETLILLSRRDLLVRYRRSIIGLLWVLFKPGMSTLIFAFVFGRLAKLPDHGVPYVVLVLSAMIPWQFFSGVLTEAGSSILANHTLITKVYLPRLLLPLSCIPVNLLDLAAGLAMLALAMAWFGCVPQWPVLLLPLAVLPLSLVALGAGLWSAALLARFADMKNVLPYLLQFGMLVSPVAFSSSLIPDHLRPWYALNPMVAPLDLFRASILGSSYALDPALILPSLGTGLLLFFTGVLAFRRLERDFADVL